MATNLTVPILLNSTHYVEGSKSTYRYKFPSGGVTFNHEDTVSLTQISMYNSIFNISEELKNNRLKMIYKLLEVQIIIPDGLYNVDDLEAYLQFHAVSQNLYLVDDKGNNQYYFNLKVNPAQYKIQIDVRPMPETLPPNWTNPAGLGQGILLYGPYTPIFEILDNNLTKILGFNTGLYPPGEITTPYSVVGQNVPQLKPTQALLVKCNLLSNMKFSNPTDLLATFTIPNGTKVGEIVEYEPNDYSYMNIHPGKYEFIELSFVNQIFEQVEILDRDLVAILLLKIIN
jgi:hypothetical protein